MTSFNENDIVLLEAPNKWLRLWKSQFVERYHKTDPTFFSSETVSFNWSSALFAPTNTELTLIWLWLKSTRSWLWSQLSGRLSLNLEIWKFSAQVWLTVLSHQFEFLSLVPILLSTLCTWYSTQKDQTKNKCLKCLGLHLSNKFFHRVRYRFFPFLLTFPESLPSFRNNWHENSKLNSVHSVK